MPSLLEENLSLRKQNGGEKIEEICQLNANTRVELNVVREWNKSPSIQSPFAIGLALQWTKSQAVFSSIN
jgi:hypothetical protein